MKFPFITEIISTLTKQFAAPHDDTAIAPARNPQSARLASHRMRSRARKLKLALKDDDIVRMVKNFRR